MRESLSAITTSSVPPPSLTVRRVRSIPNAPSSPVTLAAFVGWIQFPSSLLRRPSFASTIAEFAASPPIEGWVRAISAYVFGLG